MMFVLSHDGKRFALFLGAFRVQSVKNLAIIVLQQYENGFVYSLRVKLNWTYRNFLNYQHKYSNQYVPRENHERTLHISFTSMSLVLFEVMMK